MGSLADVQGMVVRVLTLILMMMEVMVVMVSMMMIIMIKMVIMLVPVKILRQGSPLQFLSIVKTMAIALLTSLDLNAAKYTTFELRFSSRKQ